MNLIWMKNNITKTAHAKYRHFFSCKKICWKTFDIPYKFVQNIDCGYTEAVLTSTHNLCFGSKITNIGIKVYILYKSGV